MTASPPVIMHQPSATAVFSRSAPRGLGSLLLVLALCAWLPATLAEEASQPAGSGVLETFMGWVGMGKDKATLKYYKDLEFSAPLPVDKARAALAQAEVHWQAGKWWKAHEAYKHVATNYAALVPFDEVLERQFTLAKDHFEGDQRRFLFWHFSSNDRALQIYDHILKVGPYSTVGAKALYRSALVAVNEKNYEDAVSRFNRLLTSYPESEMTPAARADLAQALLVAASDFDGDGALARQARGELDKFVARYPEHPRLAEVNENLAKAQEIEAARLLFLGHFYQRPVHAQPTAARRYLEDCITRFPRTESARQAAIALAALGHALPAGAQLPPPAEGATSASAGSPVAAPGMSVVEPPLRPLNRPDLQDKYLLPLEDLNPPQEQP